MILEKLEDEQLIENNNKKMKQLEDKFFHYRGQSQIAKPVGYQIEL